MLYKTESRPLFFQVDLTQVGLTINDHLNPPPHYDIVTDEELSGLYILFIFGSELFNSFPKP